MADLLRDTTQGRELRELHELLCDIDATERLINDTLLRRGPGAEALAQLLVVAS